MHPSLRALQWGLCILVLPRTLLDYVAAFDATPRWGQATVVVNGALFIYGGKTDEFNSFQYTSAPNTNDVLYLSLGQSFTAQSPPWDLVSSSTNSSTSQGPALAWHTLSAFNNTDVLLFGGQPGPNSPTVIVTQPDSAALLDVFSRVNPIWHIEPSGWGNEPARRIRHSACTAISGLVFIFGGEKADGSQNGFSDHYVFDPSSLTFTLLPTQNAPPDIYGHVSIILADGRIVVFGGFCQSQGGLLPLSIIWVFDTNTSEWAIIAVDPSNLPSPRMSFVAVLIDGGKIIIHGGSDAGFQSNFDDGWVLDTTTTPWTWTKIDALSQLGARRDHFAVSSNGQVIFGFGYGNNAPAPAPLQIYNPSSGTFNPTYTPPPATSTPTRTLPLPSQTPTSANGPSGTAGSGGSGGVHPTSTFDPNNPSGGGDGSPANNNDNNSKNTTAIAVGTAFGVLALIVASLGVAYYIRRQHRAAEGERQFMALSGGGDDDDDDSPHMLTAGRIPAARMHSVEALNNQGILSTLGIMGPKMRTMRNGNRRDMLADEDTRSFGEWYDSRRRDGTGGSSWSLMSILGAGVRRRSREPSLASHGSNLPTPWREKTDPFSDGASLMRDEETGFIGAAAVGAAGALRPQARRDISYASTRSAFSYRDPFADPIEEERRNEFDATYLYSDHHSDESHDAYDPARPSIRPVPPLTPLRTVMPIAHAAHPLSPLSEHTSQSSLGLAGASNAGSSLGHSNEHVLSPFDARSKASSMTSAEPTPPVPRSPGSTSIIGAANPAFLNSNQPMRRSNSWWARFSRTSLLDRRASGSSRQGGYDIRDPNPPPKLGPIEERSVISSADKNSPHGSSPGSAGVDKQLGTKTSLSPQSVQTGPPSRANSMRIYGAGGHGKSMSSLRTADSEAIERMAGTMEVIQRLTTRSQRGTGSTSSAGGMSQRGSMVSELERGERERDGSGSWEGSYVEPIVDKEEGARIFASPLEQPMPTHPLADLGGGPVSVIEAAAAGPSRKSVTPPTPPPPPPPKSDTSGKSAHSSSTNVASKVHAFERRMSMEQPTSPPPTNTKQKEERSKKRVSVDYGLVPRRSLYVANPDHKSSPTDGS